MWLGALAQSTEVWQLAAIGRSLNRIGEFGLEAMIIGERQQANHDSAGELVAHVHEQRLEGARVGMVWEQLIAINQVEKRHERLAQPIDDEVASVYE